MSSLIEIPPITDPLGKYWKQPSREDILIDDCAVMSQETFDKLAEYSATVPSGVYEGKMWKCFSSPNWYLRWYDKSSLPSHCDIISRVIVILD